MNIFCYGTLMFPEVWSVAVKGQYTAKGGYINGYEKRAVKAETYPCVIAASADEWLQGWFTWTLIRPTCCAWIG